MSSACDQQSALWAYLLGREDRRNGIPVGRSPFIPYTVHWQWWRRGQKGEPFVWGAS